MANAQELWNRQQVIGEDIDTRYKRFKRDGSIKKTLKYVIQRLKIIIALINEFKENDEQLKSSFDPAAPYFKNNYFKVIIKIYDRFHDELNALYPEISTLDLLQDNDDQHQDGNDDDNEDEQNQPPLVSSDEEQENENVDSSRSKKVEKIVKNGMTVKQLIKLFDLKSIAAHRVVDNIQRMVDGTLKELTYYRTMDLLREHLRELNTLDNDIRIHGESSSKTYLNFIVEDGLGKIEDQAEVTIRLAEEILESVTKNDKNIGNQENDMDVKLPRIIIPTFEGSYKEWQPFHDLYTRLIHKNKKLSNAMKMQYLMSSLKKEAARSISHFTGKAEDYEIAWTLLVAKYENKRLLVNEYIADLMKQPYITEGTHKEIQELHDKVYNIAYGLERVLPSKDWGEAIMLQVLTRRIDEKSFRAYEDTLDNPKEVQPLQGFLDFLSKRVIHLENLDSNYQRKNKHTGNKEKYSKDNTDQSSKKAYKDNKNDNKSSSKTREIRCKICKESHKISDCNIFTPLAIEKRLELVRKDKLCTNCLGKDHIAKQCRSNNKCNKCNKNHHTMLHDEKFQAKNQVEKVKTMTISPNWNSQTYVVNRPKEGVVLTTTLITVMLNGYTFILRALLDQGSTTNIITEEATKLLNLKRHKTYAEISGLGKSIEKADQYGNLVVQSMYNSDFKLPISAFILANLEETSPSSDIQGSWEHLENLNLADPQYKESAPIDIILGGGVYARILLPGVIKAGINDPIAQQTELGWIISGPTKEMNNTSREITLITHVEDNFTFEKFWEIEEISSEKILTLEEIECEEIYKTTHRRQSNGKYIVDLPFKNDGSVLGKSRNMAVATLLQLEKQFRKNPELKIKYIKCLQEYFDNNQIKLAEKSEDELSYWEDGVRKYRTNYLPHHAVKKDSDTKFRVVFDASRKTTSKVSLNDMLLIGPVIQDDLVTILTRWRTYEIVFTADIQKMYRQIELNPIHAEFQRMVWRENENEEIKDYVLTTVTFGTASAPHTAVRTLKQLASDQRYDHPIGTEALENDFYVDDVMTGGHSFQEVYEKQIQLRSALASAGMNLRKFASNSNLILEQLPEKLRELQIPLEINSDQTIKTLGVVWYPQGDHFTYKVNLNQLHGHHTKKIILTEIAKIYDPLGWIAPIILKGKIIMQRLWEEKVTWDEPINNNIAKEWETIRNELHLIDKLQIPRWIRTGAKTKMELHGFSDASEDAYSAVIYSRVTQTDGSIDTNIITSKTKVAPMTQISIPKLELCGAVLLSKLMAKVQKTLKVPDDHVKVWSDSTITLAWIKDLPRKYNTFVANRIGAVQTNLKGINWYHVKGAENPADIASRGVLPSGLIDNDLWWNGPKWLKDKEIKYNSISKLSTDLELKKTVLKVNMIKETNNIFARFSKFDKMIRVMSYSYRFINKTLKRTSYGGLLNLKELRETETKILKIVQRAEFHDEIESLEKKEPINRKSGLLNLHPFLDSQNLVRVGGRLQHSRIPYDQKHPIILPYNQHVTRLKVQQIHMTLLHAGSKLMIATTRQKYWVIKCKRLIKTIVNNCLKCAKAKGSVQEQLMGNLPWSRVTPSRTFSNCGLDYAGPVQIKCSKLKRANKYEGYIALFICMATKAVHLEVVTSAKAEDFIAAYKRLVSRRGAITNMYSDNGGNFTKADKILKLETEQHKRDYHAEITKGLLNNGTQFHFIPPRNPTHGGYWERAIGSFKHHFKRVIGDQKLTYEELNTVVIQIEGILNSRPLCPLTDDINDLEVLTPGHFLIGAPLISPPESSVTQLKLNQLTRWKLTQRMYEDFWKIWKEDYLNNLQLRSKWKYPAKNIEIGDIVTIKEEMVPPTRWPLARVTKIYKGEDGLVRVAEVKTKTSVLKRPVVKLCLLPTKEDPETPDVTTNARNNKRNMPLKEGKTSAKGSKCLLLFLMTCCFISSTNAGQLCNTTKFENQPGIYFENLNDVHIQKDEWKIISYFNLSTYNLELNNIEKNINKMKIHCLKQNKTNICHNTIAQLDHLVEEIHQTNKIIHHDHINNRAKRQIMVGALAIAGVVGAVQNVMSWVKTNQYEKEIEQAKINENHLHELLVNQTSISEATYNIIKEDEKRAFKQMQHFQQDLQTIEDEIQDVKVNYIFTNLALSLFMNIMYYKRLQQALINVVMDTHNGESNILMMTPQQLLRQIEVIQPYISDDVMVPQGPSGSNLLEIYKLLKIQTRITPNYILIEIKIPLITRASFNVHRVIPVPVFNGEHLISIKSSMEYLLINNLEKQYFPASKDFMNKCIFTQEHKICSQPNVIYKNGANTARCEMNLIQGSTNFDKSCRFQSSIATSNYVQLSNNGNWIYAVTQNHTINVTCDNKVVECILQGNGILHIPEGCQIEESHMQLQATREYSSTMNNSLNPPTNVADWIFNSKLEPRKVKKIDLVINDGNHNEIEAKLKQQKLSEGLWSKISFHDMHQYGLISGCFLILLIMCMTWLCCYCKRKPSDHSVYFR